jgi:hypothetical protein
MRLEYQPASMKPPPTLWPCRRLKTKAVLHSSTRLPSFSIFWQATTGTIVCALLATTAMAAGPKFNILFIVCAPGAKTGQECHSLVELVDIYPTVIDYCGIAAPHELVVQSLRPLLLVHTVGAAENPHIIMVNDMGYSDIHDPDEEVPQYPAKYCIGWDKIREQYASSPVGVKSILNLNASVDCHLSCFS